MVAAGSKQQRGGEASRTRQSWLTDLRHHDRAGGFQNVTKIARRLVVRLGRGEQEKPVLCRALETGNFEQRMMQSAAGRTTTAMQ